MKILFVIFCFFLSENILAQKIFPENDNYNYNKLYIKKNKIKSETEFKKLDSSTIKTYTLFYYPNGNIKKYVIHKSRILDSLSLDFFYDDQNKLARIMGADFNIIYKYENDKVEYSFIPNNIRQESEIFAKLSSFMQFPEVHQIFSNGNLVKEIGIKWNYTHIHKYKYKNKQLVEKTFYNENDSTNSDITKFKYNSFGKIQQETTCRNAEDDKIISEYLYTYDKNKLLTEMEWNCGISTKYHEITKYYYGKNNILSQKNSSNSDGTFQSHFLYYYEYY